MRVVVLVLFVCGHKDSAKPVCVLSELSHSLNF